MLATILRQNGLLLLLLAGLVAGLALTGKDLVGSFESLRFGEAEVRFRALASGSPDRTVVQGRQQRSKDSLTIWTTRNIEIGRQGKGFEELSGGQKLPALNAFSTFREKVVSPVADVNVQLIARQIDLFDGSRKARLLIDMLMLSTNWDKNQVQRRQAFRASFELLKAMLADAADSLTSNLDGAARADVDGFKTGLANAISSITDYQNSLSVLPSEEIDDVINSGYLVYLTYNLIDISYFSDNLSGDKSVAYFNLLFGGASQELVSFEEIKARGFDFQSTVLIANKALQESRAYNSPEETFRFATALYDFVYSFAMTHFGAPADRTRSYSPCADVSDKDNAELCRRIEYRTLPTLLNSVLFYPIQLRIDGKRLSALLLRQLSGYIEPVEKRAELLRASLGSLPDADDQSVARDIYHVLMDTLATSRVILAAAAGKDKVDPTICKQSDFEFAQAIDYYGRVREAATQLSSRSLLVAWSQLAELESRQQLTRQYCPSGG